MKLVLLGAPGAGKGTLATSLKENFKLAHISTGDMLREEMKNGTDLGKKAKQFVESGGLVPDEIVIKMIENKLLSDKNIAKGYMLDGFPRTKGQAEELDKILKNIKLPLDKALYLESSLPVVLQRLTGRRICRGCGAVYHLTNMPPKKAGICDNCQGTDLYQRADDNEETIKKRMSVYMESTMPIISYYESQGILIKINADKEASAVQEEVKKLLKK